VVCSSRETATMFLSSNIWYPSYKTIRCHVAPGDNAASQLEVLDSGIENVLWSPVLCNIADIEWSYAG